MTVQQKKILQVVLLILVAILLIRFYPLAFKIAEGAALGIREFWWAILMLILGVWIFRIARKK